VGTFWKRFARLWSHCGERPLTLGGLLDPTFSVRERFDQVLDYGQAGGGK